MEKIAKKNVKKEVEMLNKLKNENFEEYVKKILEYSHDYYYRYTYFDNFKKRPCDYSKGYKMQISYKDINIIVDLREFYKSKKYRGRETHHEFKVEINNKDFQIFEKNFLKKLKTDIRSENIEYNSKKKIFLNLKNQKNPSDADNGGAIYYNSKYKYYINTQQYRDFSVYDFFKKEEFSFFFNNLKLDDYRDKIGIYVPLYVERELMYLYESRKRTHYVLSFFEKRLSSILFLRNEDFKRKIAEHFGGFEKLLKELGQKISEGFDGKHPIILYRSGNYNYLLCKDHSTEREYLLCPPDQQTANAYVAWKSTFPVAIAYRQGDVGLALLDDKGGVLDVGVIQQS